MRGEHDCRNLIVQANLTTAPLAAAVALGAAACALGAASHFGATGCRRALRQCGMSTNESTAGSKHNNKHYASLFKHASSEKGNH